jgi:hypothetical protein
VAGISNVVIKIGAETASAVRELRQVDKALEDTRSTGQKMQGAIQDAAVPAAAALTALTAVAIKSAKAAGEDAASREQLDSQIKRITGSSDAAVAANEAWIDSTSRSVGIMDDELRPAMAGLVRTTGDVAKAQELMKLALDTSAATGKPLASVTSALSKAYNGSYGALTKLDPALKNVATSGADFATVQAALNKQVEGAAAGHAETAAGQYQKMQVSMAELQETIGYALLPVIEQLIPLATQMASVFEQHSGIIVAVAGAIAGLSAAILIANVAIKAYNVLATIWAAKSTIASVATTVWAAATWLLNAAWAASPVGVVILAIAALTAGIVLAYRHSATFRAIVQGAFSGAKAAAQSLIPVLNAVWDVMKRLWSAAAPLRSALSSAFDEIRRAIQAVIDAISSVIGAIGRIHFPSKPSWIPLAVPAGGYAPAGYAAASAGPVISINVSGAIDPESTALAIRRALTRYDRRRGLTPLGGGGTGGA